MFVLKTIFQIDRACGFWLLDIEFDILLATKGTWRGHPVKARLLLSFLLPLIFQAHSTLFYFFDLLFNETDGGLANNSVWSLKLSKLILIVIVFWFLDGACVEVVDTKPLVCLHLCYHIVVEPSQLQLFLKAIDGFLVLFEQAVDISKLLVSDHFVRQHLFLFALIL